MAGCRDAGWRRPANGGAGTDNVNYSAIAALYGLTDSGIRFTITQSAASSSIAVVRMYRNSDNTLLKTDTLVGVENIVLGTGQSRTYQANHAPTFIG